MKLALNSTSQIVQVSQLLWDSSVCHATFQTVLVPMHFIQLKMFRSQTEGARYTSLMILINAVHCYL